MEIVQYPEPVLKTPSEPVTDVKMIVDHLPELMKTMHEAKGVGLAANQVGIAQRFCLINVEGKEGQDLVLLNPEIVEGSGEATATEGCLSLPGLEVKVKRFERVKVRARTLDGKTVEFEAEGLFARAVQHELDHLNGKLIIDHAGPVAKIALRSRLKEMEKKFKARKK